ncbi:hypothetical protein KDD30_15250 [Photobacterium sp. GJ3]|uniref:hypothetical protein n=1 Tax=Photobacterium sp. GJ3 TaxID=2829502 RepID=UPI001B8DA3B7|nr:hypothetical protein [Photobacterium sp. GJ3]QUJ67373.1 hypothetical protein KDD30_15250 [Photobacterium sp. GJ3]
MNNNSEYFIDEAENGMGRCLVLTDSWSDSLKSVIDKENISVLRLSKSAGWNDNDISFIKALPELRGVEIYSWEVKDISPLESVKDIEYLGLQCEFTKAPDFSMFRNLKICKVQWRPKAKTVLCCEGLNLLNIINYPHDNLMDVQALSNLKCLQITSRKLVSLSGVENLKYLSILDLVDCPKLENISNIEKCQSLHVMEIDNCKKVYDVSSIGKLGKVKKVMLNDCGNINSLRSFDNSQSLESIFFIGNTNVEDGYLTSLLEVPTLKEIRFNERKHYTHTWSQAEDVIS